MAKPAKKAAETVRLIRTPSGFYTIQRFDSKGRAKNDPAPPRDKKNNRTELSRAIEKLIRSE